MPLGHSLPAAECSKICARYQKHAGELREVTILHLNLEKMDSFAVVKVFICILSLRYACGLDWWGNYMEGMKEQLSQYGLQTFPENTRKRENSQRNLTCPDMSPSAQVPNRADRVKPADVKVVAALGDSLTAAIGANATNILEIPTEYRQFSWSVGGYGNFSDVITLPNILKLFNPAITGFAKNSTVCYRSPSLENTGLNLAVSGANTFLLPQQTRHLIDTMRFYQGINFQDDWKVVTIFIGINDLCDFCKDKILFSSDSFIHNLTVSLDMLHKEMPRSIVNVVQLFDIEHVRKVNDRRLGCVLQRFFCSCVVQPKENSLQLLELQDRNKQFKDKLKYLIEISGRYDGKKDFAVVLQPFLKNMKPAINLNGGIDFSFFSPDCFHLSIKGHEQLAKGLWNNMLQPEGEKHQVETIAEDIQLLCPSKDHPYIYTRPQTEEPDTSSMAKGSWTLCALLLLCAFCHMDL